MKIVQDFGFELTKFPPMNIGQDFVSELTKFTQVFPSMKIVQDCILADPSLPSTPNENNWRLWISAY